MRNDFEQAYRLRLKGESYGQIKKALGIPKSTLSSWFKNLRLPKETQRILEEKGRVTQEQLMRFNRRRTKRIQAENERVRQKAFDEINSLTKRELLLIGAALYWGEGYKSERSNKGSVEISNANPEFIALSLRFFREILNVSEKKIKVSLLLHPNIDKQSAVHFWSHITGIPKKCFGATNQVSRASKGRRPRNTLPYGTLRLCIYKRQKFFQIKGWIDGLNSQTGLKR